MATQDIPGNIMAFGENNFKVTEIENIPITHHKVASGTELLTFPPLERMNVCWHRSDECKLLVAEKMGIIRFYNVESETPILSIDYSKPLSSVHWAPSDRDLIASLQLGELFIWDLTKPCLPLNNNIIFMENGGHIKFSPQGELIAAVNSLDKVLRVVHVKTQAGKLSANVTLPTNVCWHYRYPLVCIGDDFKLCFWKA